MEEQAITLDLTIEAVYFKVIAKSPQKYSGVRILLSAWRQAYLNEWRQNIFLLVTFKLSSESCICMSYFPVLP